MRSLLFLILGLILTVFVESAHGRNVFPAALGSQEMPVKTSFSEGFWDLRYNQPAVAMSAYPSNFLVPRTVDLSSKTKDGTNSSRGSAHILEWVLHQQAEQWAKARSEAGKIAMTLNELVEDLHHTHYKWEKSPHHLKTSTGLNDAMAASKVASGAYEEAKEGLIPKLQRAVKIAAKSYQVLLKSTVNKDTETLVKRLSMLKGPRTEREEKDFTIQWRRLMDLRSGKGEREYVWTLLDLDRLVQSLKFHVRIAPLLLQIRRLRPAVEQDIIKLGRIDKKSWAISQQVTREMNRDVENMQTEFVQTERELRGRKTSNQNLTQQKVRIARKHVLHQSREREAPSTIVQRSPQYLPEPLKVLCDNECKKMVDAQKEYNEHKQDIMQAEKKMIEAKHHRDQLGPYGLGDWNRADQSVIETTAMFKDIHRNHVDGLNNARKQATKSMQVLLKAKALNKDAAGYVSKLFESKRTASTFKDMRKEHTARKALQLVVDNTYKQVGVKESAESIFKVDYARKRVQKYLARMHSMKFPTVDRYFAYKRMVHSMRQHADRVAQKEKQTVFELGAKAMQPIEVLRHAEKLSKDVHERIRALNRQRPIYTPLGNYADMVRLMRFYQSVFGIYA